MARTLQDIMVEFQDKGEVIVHRSMATMFRLYCVQHGFAYGYHRTHRDNYRFVNLTDDVKERENDKT